jgi:4-amino-4-deoxy-L-arabinose transferase-like glycosyltransferase
MKDFIGADSLGYETIARNLLSGQGYLDDIGFRCYRPPGYPFFLASVYMILGQSTLLIKFIQAFFGVISTLVIYLITRSVFDKMSAFISALIFSIYFDILVFTVQVMSETLFILFQLLLLLSLLKIRNAKAKESYFWLVVSGLFLGLGILTRPILTAFSLFIPIWFFILSMEDRRSYVKKLAIIYSTFLLVMIPWMVRNYLVYHQFIFISTNGAVNLVMGNNPDANGTFVRAILPQIRAEEDIPEAYIDLYDLWKRKDEMKASRLAYKLGLQYMIENPGRTLSLSMNKLSRLYSLRIPSKDTFPPKRSSMIFISFLSFNLLLLLALWGAVFSFNIWRITSIFLFLILSETLTYMIFFVVPRHRLILLPTLIIFAGYGIKTIFSIKVSLSKKSRPEFLKKFIVFIILLGLLIVGSMMSPPDIFPDFGYIALKSL